MSEKPKFQVSLVVFSNGRMMPIDVSSVLTQLTFQRVMHGFVTSAKLHVLIHLKRPKNTKLRV